MESAHDIYEFILDHYERPRNRGTLEGADLVMRGSNPACGDVVTLYLRIHDGTTIRAAGFTGEGCTISQAAASLTTEKIVGRTVAAAQTLQADELLADLGPGVLTNRRRCATLALQTLRAALSAYDRGTKVRGDDPERAGLEFEARPVEEG